MCERYLIIRWRRPLRYPTAGPRHEIRAMSQKEHCRAWSAEMEVVAEDLTFNKANRKQAELNQLDSGVEVSPT